MAFSHSSSRSPLFSVAAGSALGLILAGFVACGGSAETSSGDGDSAGDGDSSGDGDRSGDGDGDTSGDGDGDTGGDGDGDGDVDRSCEQTLDCLLVSATCCGTCGAPSVSDMTAVRVGESEAHRAAVCDEEFPICPGCAAAPNPNLFAECVQGQCEAVDLQASPDSECSTSDECVVAPATCCECGGGTNYWDVVAINGSRAQGFRESQCAREGMGEPLACATCEYQPPTDIIAECLGGRCTLTGDGVATPY